MHEFVIIQSIIRLSSSLVIFVKHVYGFFLAQKKKCVCMRYYSYICSDLNLIYSICQIFNRHAILLQSHFSYRQIQTYAHTWLSSLINIVSIPFQSDRYTCNSNSTINILWAIVLSKYSSVYCCLFFTFFCYGHYFGKICFKLTSDL